MTIVTIHKAKTELSKLIERAVSGEQIIIARGNVPVVTLEPVDRPPRTELTRRREPGMLKHLRDKIPEMSGSNLCRRMNSSSGKTGREPAARHPRAVLVGD